MTEIETPLKAPIGVYLSRHSPNIRNIPDYGAMIPWALGEKAFMKSQGGLVEVTIKSELRWHNEAPVIDSARGEGRWVYECYCHDDRKTYAVSANRLLLP
jgi:hypothetical protein